MSMNGLMRRRLLAVLAAALAMHPSARAGEIYQATSAYHHIRVVEDGGYRLLCFDDATESRISLQDPWRGHFEYTEYFHMPWLWNTNLSRVLMIGLGGGSAQRAFEHYYPNVTIDTAELDPLVVRIARNYFGFEESERQRVFMEDGRMFLRHSTARYDLIILDAYVQGRYGSSIPQHLATKEFFELARDHLTTNGIFADNVIGTLDNWHAGIVGATYRTLKTVFPQVYLFPAKSSMNVVLQATRATVLPDLNGLRRRAALLAQTGRVTLPGFRERLERIHINPPAGAASSPILTDDYAPVEGLSEAGGP
ncbi:MAG: fused MFS/spermidine synthase [Verrucomicrobiota bacterium]|jgi:spermidine synthase